jgi:hypothetical protein
MEYIHPEYIHPKYLTTEPLPDGYYRISGQYINDLYDHAIQNFNEQSAKWEKGSYPYTYAQAFWNGYGAAMAGLRDCARQFPVDPQV